MVIDEIVGLVEIDCEGYDVEQVLTLLQNAEKKPEVKLRALIPYITFSAKRAHCVWHDHRLQRFHIANGRLWAHSQYWDIKYKIPYAKVMVHNLIKHASWA